jgi:hypothetical protein
LSVSSVSAGSISWEEYLEKLKQLRQQKQAFAVAENSEGAAAVADLNPDTILAELESLQDDPEKLKARAAELASQAAAAAETSTGGHMLEKLAADLEGVAKSGDLSAMQEKLSRGGPPPAMMSGPGGMSGASGARAKGVEARLLEDEEEDEDEDDLIADTIEELLEQLEEAEANRTAETAPAFDISAFRLQRTLESEAVNTGDKTQVAVGREDIENLVSGVTSYLQSRLSALYTQAQNYASLNLVG